MASTALRHSRKSNRSRSAGKNRAPPAEFMEQFFAQLSAHDLAVLPHPQRAAIGAGFWRFMQQRKPRQVLIRVYNPDPAEHGWKSRYTAVEIVHDDMPFLVDSTIGAINRRGFAVQQVIHPVMRVRRDRAGKITRLLPPQQETGGAIAESYTHIQCDEIRDPKQVQELAQHLRTVFHDVRAAVEDWPKMLRRAAETMEEIRTEAVAHVAAGVADETRNFLQWLRDNNFTFLGYRRLELGKRRGKLELTVTPGSGLGILRDPQSFVFNDLHDLGAQPPEVQHFMQEPRLLLVTKTNLATTVHRPSPMDAVFIKRFDAQGKVLGEHLFTGLFTSYSYARSPREVPVLRQKVRSVLAKANFGPASHDGKALTHILDNYPRDELIQISARELYAHAIGILRLQERQRVALFTRLDPFERMVSCLIYVPRDQYDSGLRNRFQQVLEASFAGTVKNVNVRIDDSALARIFISVATTPGAVPRVDLAALEDELRDLARPWSDRLRDHLHTVFGDNAGRNFAKRYADAFPLTYREGAAVEMALQDIGIVEAMQEQALGVNLLQGREEPEQAVHLRIFHRGGPLALSRVLPMIENMGLYVNIHNGPYVIRPQGAAEPVWLHDFAGENQHRLPHTLRNVKLLFEDTLHQVWHGRVPDDGFNQLALRAALPWREVNILRTLAKYAQQIRSPHSQAAMIAALAKHPRLTQLIVALFLARHDPALARKSAALCRTIEREAAPLLAGVPNLDEDRIMRRFFNLVRASLRTNYFQTDETGRPKDYLAIKFDSMVIDHLPLPRPRYEIFVASPRVEAIHLRGGKVARGGIRWSDRPEDYRTEVLGLMKAQMVKNSVIVPVGAKGGFIVKQPDAQDPVKEAVACYRIMMRGLLDLTDNRAGGKIVPPKNTVRHDGDDPYLVVAADKGTAKFSDIANNIALEYGFWLGDAFASGGSAGYDHKHMAITARGAWEAVKRHFRERGKDIQREDFTCIGVGDMSGDVFGNGMLQSKHTRLTGAFDHRHIFCDPNPDPARSFKERQRLFRKPAGSWADYDAKAISKGGGVFARTLKTVKITPEMQAAYGITAGELPPAELIQAMLRAPVDLLYFGGIGTYVKAAEERHEEAGDRANDALRVDGAELQAKVIGEGANIAMTQRGRVEFALKGGRLNTDAIDNSAGVDTSDHEVNIKIALSKAVAGGQLPLKARNKLLTAMTDAVAALVLRDNYLQTQALTIAEAQASELLGSHARMMRMLERAGLLNRRVEDLPDEDELAERARLGRGLTRPDLAVLIAYAKIWLCQQLTASRLPDAPFLRDALMQYFPPPMRVKFAPLIEQHQLRRELVATIVTNGLINRAGIHFVSRMAERTGRSAVEVTQAYLLAGEAFGLDPLWHEIEQLDNKVPAAVQTAMHLAVNQVLDHAVPWLLRAHRDAIDLEALTGHYRKGVADLSAWLDRAGGDLRDPQQQQDRIALLAAGVPPKLAGRVTLLPLQIAAADVQSLSRTAHTNIAAAAEIYFRLDRQFGCTWLREKIAQLPAPTPWQRDAATALREEMFTVQRRMAAAILRGKGGGEARFRRWCEHLGAQLTVAEQMLQELRTTSQPDLAMMTLMVRQLGALAG